MSFELAVVWGIGICTILYSLALLIPCLVRIALLEVYKQWRQYQKEKRELEREFADPGTDFMRIDPRDTRPVPELMKQ
jgi:hypothetical protein